MVIVWSLGNMFYLVMPQDSSGGLSEESSTDDVTRPPLLEATTSPQLNSEEDSGNASCIPLTNDQPENLDAVSSKGEVTSLSQSSVGVRRHVVKNVDEIFQTIEELMNKLHKLRVRTLLRHQPYWIVAKCKFNVVTKLHDVWYVKLAFMNLALQSESKSKFNGVGRHFPKPLCNVMAHCQPTKAEFTPLCILV